STRSQRHHPARRHGDHPGPEKRPAMDRGLPCAARLCSRTDGGYRLAPQRNPARHALPCQRVPDAADRIPRPKSRRGKDARAGSLGPVALNRLGPKSFGERIAARDPDRQAAEIHIRVIRHCRSDQWRDMARSSAVSTLRHRRKRPRGLNLKGKGERESHASGRLSATMPSHSGRGRPIGEAASALMPRSGPWPQRQQARPRRWRESPRACRRSGDSGPIVRRGGR
ncbi:hypothetical protein EV657_1091, partial [Rhodovulum visakhapatnamense]